MADDSITLNEGLPIVSAQAAIIAFGVWGALDDYKLAYHTTTGQGSWRLPENTVKDDTLSGITKSDWAFGFFLFLLWIACIALSFLEISRRLQGSPTKPSAAAELGQPPAVKGQVQPAQAQQGPYVQ